MLTFDHCFVRRKEAQFLIFLRRAMFKAVNPSPSLAVITVMSLLTNNLQEMTTHSNSLQSASFGYLDDAFRFFMTSSYCSPDDTNPQVSCATCLHALRNSQQKKTAVVLAKLCRKPYKWLSAKKLTNVTVSFGWWMAFVNVGSPASEKATRTSDISC